MKKPKPKPRKSKEKSEILFDFNKLTPAAVLHRSYGNCGMTELACIGGGPVDCLARVFADCDLNLVFFSDNIEYGNGQELADYIEEHKLGTVVVSPVADNPNEGSKIQARFWVVDHEKLDAWGKKHVKR